VLFFLPLEIVAALVKLEVKNREKIPNSPHVLAATHRGELDPFLARRALREPFWGKRKYHFIHGEVVAHPFIQELFRTYFGALFVSSYDREKNKEALREAIVYLKEGGSIVIAPEGYEHGKGVIYPGAAILACQAGCPILPLHIDKGVFVRLSGSPPSTLFWLLFPLIVWKSYWKEARAVKFTFLDPIYPDLKKYKEQGSLYIEELTQVLGKVLGLCRSP